MGKARSTSAARPFRAQDALPQWTEKVVIDSSGRDPLGLSRVSQVLADDQLKAIITITPRARYYSLYSWMLWHIEHTEHPKDRAAFIRALQRREAVVAQASLMAEDRATVLGAVASTTKLAQARERGQVSTQFRILPSAPLGGYGNNYASCLAALGLSRLDEDGIERVSKDLGEELAQQTHRSLEKTPYVSQRRFTSPVFDLDILERSHQHLALNALQDPLARGERELLTEVLFSFRPRAIDRLATNRRLSLARLLSAVAAYQDSELPLAARDISFRALYLPTYFGMLSAPSGESAPYLLPAPLRSAHASWRQFCLHEYLTWALEWLLVAVLGVVQDHKKITGAGVVEALLDQPFSSWLAAMTGQASKTPGELLEHIFSLPAQPPTARVDFLPRFPFGDPLCEATISDTACENEAEIAAHSCLLLAVLFASWDGVRDEAYHQTRVSAGPEPWVGSFMSLVRGWRTPGMTWRTALGQLVEKWLIPRHAQVVYEKGRLQSSWFHMEEGGLVYDQDYRPYFRQDRHTQALQILADLGLVEITDGLVRITKPGRTILQRVLEAV